MADEAKLHTPIHSTLKYWLCDVQLGGVVLKNWAPSVGQCWLQVLKFWYISSIC